MADLLEFSAYPLRIFFSKKTDSYKIIKFRATSGPYAGKDVTIKGNFKNEINDVDIQEKNNFNITGILDTKPNKYNATNIFLKNDGKALYYANIDNHSRKWLNILFRRIGLNERMTDDILNKLAKQDPNDEFVQKMSAINDGVHDKFSSRLFNIRNLFQANSRQLINALPLLPTVGQSTAIGYANRIKMADDSIRALTNFEYETQKRGYSMTDSKAELILKHFSGNYKAAMKYFDNDFYQIINVKGISIVTADKIYLSNKDNNLYDEVRIRSVIMIYLKNEFEDHRSWMTINDIHDYLMTSLAPDVELVSGDLEEKIKTNMNKAMRDLVKENQIIIYQDIDTTTRVARKDIFNFERNLYGILKRISESDEIKNNFNPKLIERGIEIAEKEQKFKFTDEQIEVIKGTLSHNIVSINGYAGTGKSSIVRAINHIMRLSQMHVTQVAFTGRAADSLSKSSNAPAQTVHSALHIINDNDVQNIFKEIAKSTNFQDDSINDKFPNTSNKNINSFPQLPMVSGNAIIVDEYPTLSIILFAALAYSALNTGQKLILIGDSGQLPAINFSTDQAVNNIPFIKHYNLSQIKRQNNQSKIIEHSLEVRNGEVPNDFLQHIKENHFNVTFNDINYDEVNSVKAAQQEASNIVMVLRKAHIKPEDILLLSPVNRINDVINFTIQSYNSNFQDPNVFFMVGENYDKAVYLDDLVINNKNQDILGVPDENGDSKQFRIYNGNVGKVIRIYKSNDVKFMDVDYGPIGIAHYRDNEAAVSNINLAYAITTHKAQGSTVKNVIAIFLTGIGNPNSATVSRQMLYTMMTRPSENLYLITNTQSLQHGVKNNININAHSNFSAIDNPNEIIRIVGN